nr:CLIP domain-containing serine protease 2-like [Aedes albopictus]
MIDISAIFVILSFVIGYTHASKCVLPEPGVCGVLPLKSDETDLANTAFPWMAVLIAQPQQNGPIVAICGGSLISDVLVLTAAHCFNILPDFSMLKVRLGGWNITTERSCNDRLCDGRIIDVAIETAFIHENFYQDFNSTNIHHDVALIKLVKRVNFTDFITPICMAESNSCTVPEDLKKFYRVVGWNILGKDYVANLTDFVGDRQQYSISTRSTHGTDCDYIFQPTIEICTKQVDNSENQYVDFGRSLISKESDGYWYLYGHGVWEFGNPDAMPYESDIFTRIACYRSWIESRCFLRTTFPEFKKGGQHAGSHRQPPPYFP